MRWGGWAALPGLLLAGCTIAHAPGAQPVVMFNSALRGPVPISGSGPPSGLATPPGTAFAASAHARDGIYSGTGIVLNSNGGICGPLSVTGFHVHGDQVRWAEFSGRIDASNGLQIGHGGGFNRSWLIGQFDGPTFSGTLQRRSCSFMLRLTRSS